MEVTTTNTAGTGSAATPINVQAGEGRGVSFDFLEQITNEMQQSESNVTKEEKKAKSQKTVEKSVDDVEAKDYVAEKKVETKPKEKVDEKPKAEKEPKEGKEEKPKLEGRKVKAKAGDQELELPEDALFTIKVDGKDVPVTYKDLAENYSGKTVWSRKFTELDRQTKDHARKVGEVESKIKTLMQEEDPEMRFYHMAKLAGQDPVAVRQKYFEDNMKMFEKYALMSDDERKADFANFENRVLKHELEQQRSAETQRTQFEQISKKVSELQKAHKVSSDEFNTWYDQLEGLAKNGSLADKGIQSEKNLTPEFVVEIITKDRMFNEAYKIAGELKLDNAEKRVFNFIESAYNDGFKTEDIPDLMMATYGGKPKAKAITEKVKEREEFLQGRTPVKSETKASEALLFDDIL